MKNTLLFGSAALTSVLTLGLVVSPDLVYAQDTELPQNTELSQDIELPQNSDLSATDQTATPLKPGDRLRLIVAGFPDLSGDQMVMADGTIQMPMAGDISVGGLTPTEATASITAALLSYVRRPQVGLSLLSLSPLRISVTGEVVHPGPRLLTPSNPQDQDITNERQDSSPVTLSDALTLAGGITPNADLRNIVIRRASSSTAVSPTAVNPTAVNSIAVNSTPEETTEGTRTEIKVNLWQAIVDGDLAANPRIYDGDEIVVPTAQVSSADQQASLASTIAPTIITVQVAGEVQRPGQIEISPNRGVSEAVAAAGGPTDDADLDSVELYRMSSEGRLERQTLEFGEASAPLMNGDLIVVDKTTTGGVLDFLGRLIPPISPFLYLIQ
jgi:polysaccharide export outer membrane protein